MAALRDWGGRVLDNIGLKEWNYDRLKQSELPEVEDEEVASKTEDSSRIKSLVLKVGGAIFLVVIFLFAIARTTINPTNLPIVSQLLDNGEVRQSFLHVLFPANGSSTEMCQTTFSAAALDYSTLRVLGWEATPDFTDNDSNLKALFQLHNVLSWINQLTRDDQADELIFILDSSDVWFQQRPAALISKYHAINARANARIASRLGSKLVEETNITQTIVFSAQRECSTNDDKALECYAVPPSDLRGSVYGDKRDSTDLPRHLHAGSIIGPVGDVKALFQHALIMVENTPSRTYKSAQDVFARIYGEQSYQREAIRARHLSWWSKLVSFFGRDPRDDILNKNYGREQMNPKREDEKKEKEPAPERAPFDFKIGLDFYGEISVPTMAQDKEFAWVEHDSKESIEKAAQAVGVGKPHKLEIAKEIANSAPPFWTPSYTGWLPLPLEKTWSQVPMLTNMFTGVAPVTVHHKTLHKGEQKQLDTTWKDTWFYPHLRPMLTAKGSTVRRPIAVVNGPKGREEWWNPHEEIAGLRFEDGGMPGIWRVWEDVCNDEQMSKELFADGQGPWKQPVYVPDDKGQAHEVLHKWMQKTDGKLLHDVI